MGTPCAWKKAGRGFVPRQFGAVLIAVAVSCLAWSGSDPIEAAEPGRFTPAPDAAPSLHEELRLSPVIPQSFLDLSDPGPLRSPGNRSAALPAQPAATVEVLPTPATAQAADPATMLPETIAPPQAALLKNPRPPEPPADAFEMPDAAVDDRPEPLVLAEVLGNVLLHYPLLQAVERERAIAAGRLTSAMGAFDTKLTAAGTSLAPGTYENYRSDLGVSQQFMTGGISGFAGFRTGFGDFPTYNLGQKTADAGEWRGGLNIPFARDREIDRARATRTQAQIDVSLAEPTIERSRLDYMRSAARAYWAWMGSGERHAATERLLELAVDRDEQLELKVKSGIVANIERLDNQQNIALRNGLVVQAERAVQQSSIDLSLYHRDVSGRPLLAQKSRMRPLPAPEQPTLDRYRESLDRALSARPEFERFALQRQKLLVERKLAVNQTLPGIDGQLTGNQDAGFGKSPLSGPNGLDRQVLQAALVFQMPAQRRDAFGKMQSLDAQLTQINRQISYAGDQVRAEIQDAFSLLERAYEFHEQAKQRLELARLVALAEREQLRLGRSDVLRVTLREQAKFEADIAEIMARQEFWRAESDLRAADTSLGLEVSGRGP
jgi:outer membrane protein TolC